MIPKKNTLMHASCLLLITTAASLTMLLSDPLPANARELKQLDKIQVANATIPTHFAERLIGKPVYSVDRVLVGQVTKIILDDSRQVSGILIEVGKFMGFGSRNVLIQPREVYVRKANDKVKVFLRITRASLDEIPEYNNNKSQIIPKKGIR